MFSVHRILIVYAVAIPLALILGYLVATPDMASIAVVAMVLFFLALPLLIQWNHGLLIFFWNSAFIVGFLPGQVQLWLVFAGLTFGMAMVHHVMGHRSFLRAPELTMPILFLTAVVVLTAKIRGGMGLHSLGNASYGGKHYVYACGAIMGYFALTSQPISALKSSRAVNWFFLSGMTYGLTNLIYVLGPALYFLYFFITAGSAYEQAAADYGQEVVKRFGGLGATSIGLLSFALARWGIKGIFQVSQPWRLLVLAAALAGGLFSGFRSVFGLLGTLLIVQFMVEGLWKTFFLPAFLFLGVLCMAPMLLFADKMPPAVQRALAVFPVDLHIPVHIDPAIQGAAAGSSLWRVEMWHEVWEEVPEYLLIGKGYAIDPTDLYLADEATKMGILPDYSLSIAAGDYHSGGLSILIPFGVFGSAAFLWVLGAGIKVLYCNRRYGEPRLKMINNLFFSYFLTQCFFYFFVFGSFDSQLYVFLGLLGMSVSLNGGVCRKKAPKAVPVPASAAAIMEPA
jgi:hypothetical protein